MLLVGGGFQHVANMFGMFTPFQAKFPSNQRIHRIFFRWVFHHHVSSLNCLVRSSELERVVTGFQEGPFPTILLGLGTSHQCLEKVSNVTIYPWTPKP